MNTQKHTPGPWVATNCGSHIQVHREGWPRDAWSVCSFGFQANDKANAKLIAAAPDLLAALKRALSLIEDLPYPENHMAATIRETISKAEGNA
jgi:hypothetical protein